MSDQRTIVITGVTRGLGRSMTEAFIARGHTVFGCGRSRPEIQQLQKRFDRPNAFTVLDVVSDAEAAHWASEVLSRGSAPDLLINNAALINKNNPLWKVSFDEFSTVIDVNIKGVANIIRHFVPSMIQRNRGVIINFSSGWGRSTSGEVAPYCATKWAIEGLTQALAQELPSGMAAVPLNPGIIDTSMLQSCFGSAASNYQKSNEWAEIAVPYLLSLGPRHNGMSVTVPGAT
jgi:NAD(P)-dependent dehydrogenase (short-subunit alcohol dehydrogenase family)